MEIFGIRAMLEVGAIELAVPAMTDETIKRLWGIYGKMQAALEHYDDSQWLALNREFHSTIYEGCQWARLRSLINAQANALLPYQRAAASLLVRKARAHQEHHEMLLAAEARDSSKLARLTSDHLSATAKELIGYLSSQRNGA